MRVLPVIVGLLLFVGISSSASGQSFGQGKLVDAKIDFKGLELTGPYVVISYDIPYSGMVEIRLFDDKGNKVWQNQYAHTPGENRIVLKASKFHPGDTYAYTLNYKKDQIREEFVIPPSNFME